MALRVRGGVRVCCLVGRRCARVARAGWSCCLVYGWCWLLALCRVRVCGVVVGAGMGAGVSGRAGRCCGQGVTAVWLRGISFGDAGMGAGVLVVCGRVWAHENTPGVFLPGAV